LSIRTSILVHTIFSSYKNNTGNIKSTHINQVTSNSHFETNFECCSAYGTATLKIGFLKGSLRLPFKKPIFIMRIAAKLQRFALL